MCVSRDRLKEIEHTKKEERKKRAHQRKRARQDEEKRVKKIIICILYSTQPKQKSF